MRPLVVLSLLACSLFSTPAFAAWDIFQSYVIIDAGSGNQFLAGGYNADAAATFSGSDLGAFAASDALTLNGGELKTYKNGSSNVCGGNVYYRVYASGDTPGSFSSVALPYDSELANAGDQKWDETAAGIDLLAGLTAGGAYTLEVYWDLAGAESDPAGCGETKFDSDFGNNFTASFTFNVPGCTDPNYAEYDANANTDDSSCTTFIDPCDGALVLGSVSVTSVPTAIDAADGEIDIDITTGTATAVDLTGINGAGDYSFSLPGAMDGILPGTYDASAEDAGGCNSNTVSLIVPYAQCCDGCGVYDVDTDGICDDSDNCTDKSATNYNDPANEACIFPGCTDPAYMEYDATANTDDGSCTTLIVKGCMDPSANNFNPDANVQPSLAQLTLTINLISDLSSFNPQYPRSRRVSLPSGYGTPYSPLTAWESSELENAGTVIKTAEKPEGRYRVRLQTSPSNLFDHFDTAAVVLSGDVITSNGQDTTFYLPDDILYWFDCAVCHYSGCTDPDYVEYVANANLDDGSCSALIVEGCTDPAADNYNATANTDDGSCIITGCTDPAADNYNAAANTDDDSCIFTGCTDPAADNYDATANTDDGSCIFYGCTDPAYVEYDATANTDDDSCTTLIVEGCTDAAADNYDATANTDDGSCIFYGCTDTDADNYDATANTDDGSCIYYGCTDADADNYDATANTDDGSCIFYGCTDTDADNYDATANTDDGSCIFYGCTDTDADNYDATANTDDGSCIFYGCTDTDADNYDATANTDDGSCIFYGCTDADADNYDATANTNDGSCIFYGCTDAAADNYDATANTDDGSCIYYGCTDAAYMEYDATANTDDGSCQCLVVDPACVSPSMDGYGYDVVQIGCQCWFAENLRTTEYGNGDVIPANLQGLAAGLTLADLDWYNTTSGATAVYGEGSSNCGVGDSDASACDETQSLTDYGRLYNWYAVDDARGLCPSGWHVPTNGEWDDLKDYITSQVTGSTEGRALKSTSGWNSAGNGTDDFGFSALPGGYRDDFGRFMTALYSGYWWSSSLDGTDAVNRRLTYDSDLFGLNNSDKRSGYSVRCLKD
jgi:uncharacterized protein (TIGR02145 family)